MTMAEKKEAMRRNYLLLRIFVAICNGAAHFGENLSRNSAIIGGVWMLSYFTLHDAVLPFLYPMSAVLLSLAALAVIGNFIPATLYADDFITAGFFNRIGEAPIFLQRVHRSGCCYDYYFYSKGLPLSEWKESKNAVENALNLSIQMFRIGRHKREIIISAVSGYYQIPDKIPWTDNLIEAEPYKMVLGDSFGEKAILSLKRIPHILVGGASGSGKTMLVQCLIRQCIMKGFTTYIIDFKGGVDFPKYWEEKETILMDRQDVIDTLSVIVNQELRERKNGFEGTASATLTSTTPSSHIL